MGRMMMGKQNDQLAYVGCRSIMLSKLCLHTTNRAVADALNNTPH